MSSASYTLSSLHGLVTHGFGQHAAVVRDGLDMDRLELQAKARSGDYFVTVATEIEHVLRDAVIDEATKDYLHKLVSDLLYLQQHYELKKK